MDWRRPLLHCTVLVTLSLAAPLALAGPGQHAVASAHPAATEAGEAVLRDGGNAFDAAVAITAALGVAEPYGSGLGGGGFFLLYEASSDRSVMLDARETAPAAADRDMYLDADGEVIDGLSLDGVLGAGIPGMPAGMDHLAREYGRLSLADSLAPAIRLAEDGVPVSGRYLQMAGFRHQALRDGADARDIYLEAGRLPDEGAILRQPDLAVTLRRLADEGRDGFYTGDLAERLVAGVREAGGIWTLDDLAGYAVVERDPVRLDYLGATITTASPPSSGGVALGQILNILAFYDLEALAPDMRVHLTIEAMRRAYRDRAEYLGDPDHVDMPLKRLLSREYAAGLRATIHPDTATPSRYLPLSVEPQPEVPGSAAAESRETTHFSVIDAEGNRVAATLTLNYPFGSGYVVPGTGVLLNNEMDDFSAKPGEPNAYGLVGFEANAIAPQRRPLSSMSPTFVETQDRVAILGTPGGSRIITMVLHGVFGVLEGQSIEEVVAAPRYHHQYLPDRVEHETGAFDAELRGQLVSRGHQLVPQVRPFGDMNAILWERGAGRLEAASDPRGEGEARVFQP
ncbi:MULTISPECIES: gamma-glutamyltransferase [Thioalkalivibrio]|uniref:gamma-glutamyltransferase n=1 Tax=Thioalkalivibrio TaxID=106633 RepID=UPI00036A1125|nr:MULTISPECIES: gamma-glutamyltransferase [Thioalkalivibrio]OOC50255.1 gamma-glutamyltransferase [Thioalkalivibrio versutus]